MRYCISKREEQPTACTLRQLNLMTRHVIVWSVDHSAYHHYGSYVDHADGRTLMYQARAEYPDLDRARLTDRQFEYLESIA